MTSTTTQKKVRMKDVAHRAGVSAAAVSMALSDSPEISRETKHRIRAACEEIGYLAPWSPILSDTANGTARYGMMMVGASLSDEAIGAIAQAFVERAAQLGLRLELTSWSWREDGEAFLQALQAFAGDLGGVLLCGAIPPDWLRRVELSGIRYVMIGHYLASGERDAAPEWVRMVCSSEYEQGRFAASWLIGQGHERIGFVCERLFPGMYFEQMLDGYRVAHLHADLPLRKDYLHVAGGEFRGGRAAAEHFRRMTERPTAYVVPDARMAASFLSEAADLGVEIDRRAVVVSGFSEARLRQYGLADSPAIVEDMSAMSGAALALLQRDEKRPDLGRVCMQVPFKTRNMDASG